MATEAETLEYLNQLKLCWPRSFFGKLDKSQMGLGFVLSYLAEAKETVFAGDLAREMNVSTARIAALLRKMEKNGLLIRKGSPDDARKTIVEITPEGIAQALELKHLILEKIEILIDRIGKEDMQTFIELSFKIKEALEE